MFPVYFDLAGRFNVKQKGVYDPGAPQVLIDYFYGRAFYFQLNICFAQPGLLFYFSESLIDITGFQITAYSCPLTAVSTYFVAAL